MCWHGYRCVNGHVCGHVYGHGYGNAFGHGYGHVYGHEDGHAYGHVFGHGYGHADARVYGYVFGHMFGHVSGRVFGHVHEILDRPADRCKPLRTLVCRHAYMRMGTYMDVYVAVSMDMCMDVFKGTSPKAAAS